MPALIAIAVLIALFVASWGSGTQNTISSPPEGTSVTMTSQDSLVSSELKPQRQDDKTPSSEGPALWLLPSTGATSAPLSPQRIGHPGTTVPGQVTVELAKTSFREGETVQTTVANGLDQPVYSRDQKSACTIVMLERRENFTWEKITGCAMRMLPSVVEINPGDTVEVRLNPHSGLFLRGRQPPAFGEGNYRVSFSYWLATNRERETTVTSPDFVVTP